MAKDIEIQRKRLGGNFVVARAIGSKKERNHIRSMLPDCIFIILSMTKESQMKRLLSRHGEDESGKGVVKFLNDIHKYFEPPEESEENTYNIDITEDMTPRDVMNIALEILDSRNN